MATPLLLLLPPLVLSMRASTIFSIRSFNASATSFQSGSSSSGAGFGFSPVPRAPGTPGASLLGSCSPAGVLGVTRPEPVSGSGSLYTLCAWVNIVNWMKTTVKRKRRLRILIDTRGRRGDHATRKERLTDGSIEEKEITEYQEIRGTRPLEGRFKGLRQRSLTLHYRVE